MHICDAVRREVLVEEATAKGESVHIKHEIMTLPEVADYLRVTERTIYDWAQKGKIPAVKLGSAWRFKRSEIERWMEERKTKPRE